MKRFGEVLLVAVHVIFDGAFVGSGSVVVEGDPAVVILLPKDREEGGEIDAACAEDLIEVYAVVFLLAGAGPFQPWPALYLASQSFR